MAETLKERAYKELKSIILKGEIKPGEFLTERILVERLAMSRTPIRSALERLDVEGLVNYTPNKGLAVAEISIQRAVDFYDIRIALESHVVRKLAARSWSESDISWFRHNLAEQSEYVKLNDHAAFTDADSRFHLQLAVIYENSEIITTMENLQDKLFQIATKVLRKDANRIKVSLEDHTRIFDSILAGQAEDSVLAMTNHLEFGRRILVY